MWILILNLILFLDIWIVWSFILGFLGDSDGKVSSSIQKTWVRKLGQEDPLEKGMASYSSVLAWRISQTEEPGRLQSKGLQGVEHDWAANTFTFQFHWSFIFEGSYFTLLKTNNSFLSSVGYFQEREKKILLLCSGPEKVVNYVHSNGLLFTFL